MSNLTYKRLLVVAGLWSIGGVVLALLQRPLQDWLWLWADFLNIAYAIAGIALLAAALWKAWQWRHDFRKVRGFLSAAGVTAVGGIALALTGGYLEARGTDGLVRFRFSRNHAAYEQIVRTVLADSAKSWADSSVLCTTARQPWPMRLTPVRRSELPFRSPVEFWTTGGDLSTIPPARWILPAAGGSIEDPRSSPLRMVY